jgi:hypothetical protein
MKNTYPGDRMLDMRQARTAARRYTEHALPKKVVLAQELATEPDNRKKYLKASLTRERARGRYRGGIARRATQRHGDTRESRAGAHYRLERYA